MKPEFSRFIDTTFFTKAKKDIPFSANQEERAALADRFNVQAIEDFGATIDIVPLKRDPFMRFDIYLYATVTQTCVVSLQPVEEIIAESFSILLSHYDEEDIEDSIGLSALSEEEHETFYMGDADIIDIGEVLSQYLSLFMDPYPRHKDATLDHEESSDEKESPLEKLKGLKKDSAANP